MNHYCTYFDRHYLPRALALFESLAQFDPGPYEVFAVCLDEVSRIALRVIQPPGVTPVALHEIEAGDAALLAARADRTLIEYYWTLTPSIMLRLMGRIPAGTPLVYLDADMFFYSAPKPVFAEFEGYDALIHEHRFGPELQHFAAAAGRFNVGLVGVRNNSNGHKILTWWRERCLEWCFNRHEDGKFGDQLYLDEWPVRFERICVCEHLGVGLAPWNHNHARIRVSAEGLVMIDAAPLIIYHFHTYVCVAPGLHLASEPRYAIPPLLLVHCHQPYSRMLDRQQEVLRTIFPDHAFGLNPDFTITTNHTVVRSGVAIPSSAWRKPVPPPRARRLVSPTPLTALGGVARIVGLKILITGLRTLGALSNAEALEQGTLARLTKKYQLK